MTMDRSSSIDGGENKDTVDCFGNQIRLGGERPPLTFLVLDAFRRS